jgi:hypothetical protein
MKKKFGPVTKEFFKQLNIEREKKEHRNAQTEI